MELRLLKILYALDLFFVYFINKVVKYGNKNWNEQRKLRVESTHFLNLRQMLSYLLNVG